METSAINNYKTFKMFTHNQLLTQITNVVNARRHSFSYHPRITPTDITCRESFLEAAKSFTEFSSKCIPGHALDFKFGFPFFCRNTSIQLNGKEISTMENIINSMFDRKFKRKRKKCASPVQTEISSVSQKLVLGFVNRIMFSAHKSCIIHIRTFKTERNKDAEVKRNPGIFNRLRTLLGFGETLSKDSEEFEKIRTMMAKEGVDLGDKKKMKLAFAEGYFAGAGSHQSGKFDWFKGFQILLTFALFACVFATLIAVAGGSMFPLNNQVELTPLDIKVTFNDVKGVDEAKQELRDIVEFLKNPEKFSMLGGKLPKGVLLVGPPGTGKTLLARAVAGEADVPFFHVAGSEFNDVYVGLGARRVRELFKLAKEHAPCVIFIDEIDSVGSTRTDSVLHPYANQTINQLLSEMDGFSQNQGVIVLGATNRRNDLDKALLRPGRFDVEVIVQKPDFTGRKDILTMYLNRVRAKDVDIDTLARGTTGFTGADLENMVNQAALKAAIEGAEFVTTKYLEHARDKVLMGPERKLRIPDEETNKITAYHEGGHAVVAFFTKHSHPVHKVTIIPRGPSLGHTAYIPEKERYHVTKAQLLATMDTMMGGRAAEELIFGKDKITSGASSDLQRATEIAVHMVKHWGMSSKAGLRTHNTNKDAYVVLTDISPQTASVLDEEIQRILQESYERAKTILKAHQHEHKMLSEALLKYETLDAEEVKGILGAKGPQKYKPENPLNTPSIHDLSGF